MSQNRPNESFPHDREFRRSTVSMEVELHFGEIILPACRTRDVSLRGVFAYCDTRPPLGEPCEVAIHLNGAGLAPVCARGKVVRVDDDGVAIEFEELGVDDFAQLKALVFYNSSNPEQVEQEIESHCGIHRNE